MEKTTRTTTFVTFVSFVIFVCEEESCDSSRAS